MNDPNKARAIDQADLTAAVHALQRDVRRMRVQVVALIVVLVVVILCAADPPPKKPKFEEIDVERINIVEADGKLRLVISNKARAPDVVLDGRTIPGRQGGRSPGLIFYNERGECGGLVFDSIDRGDVHGASAALLFDQYRQDQTIGIMYGERSGQRAAGLRVWDRPDTPLTEYLDKAEALKKMPDGPEKDAAAKNLRDSAASPTRVVVGKSEKKAAVVMLADAKGRPRINMIVDATGDPRLEFLDESGRVILRLPPDAPGK
jgi:hypothetical protein